MSYFDDNEDQIAGGGRYSKVRSRMAPRRGLAEPANPPPVCNRCGAADLKWCWNENGNWQLFEISREGSVHNRNVPHQCDPITTDDFDVVPATTPTQPTESSMLYNRHSDTELERAVYIDPANSAARAEMIRRVPDLLGARSDEQLEAEKELVHERADHVCEISELEYDLADAEKHVADLTGELEAANERIANLTFAEDLV